MERENKLLLLCKEKGGKTRAIVLLDRSIDSSKRKKSVNRAAQPGSRDAKEWYELDLVLFYCFAFFVFVYLAQSHIYTYIEHCLFTWEAIIEVRLFRLLFLNYRRETLGIPSQFSSKHIVRARSIDKNAKYI